MQFLDINGVKRFKKYTDDTFITSEEVSEVEEATLENFYTKTEIDNIVSNLEDEIQSGGGGGGGTITETDPTVPAWAKQSTKPTYTAAEVGAQETLVSGTNIKTINNQSILGSGNITITSGSGGETNVIEVIKVNGSTLTPDSNKAVDIMVPAAITESTVSNWGFTKNAGTLTSESDPIFSASAAAGITSSDITSWNNKVSNVQSDWNATTGMGVILNKPTIPTTLDQISDGNTRKLSNYIPKSGGDLEPTGYLNIVDGETSTHVEAGISEFSDTDNHFSVKIDGTEPQIIIDSGQHEAIYRATEIETSINNTNVVTLTFPSTSGVLAVASQIPSAVTESTVSGWGFTKNAGTITGITMNGTSKGTNGVVDLGTVLTAHQDISGKQDTITDLATIRSNASAGANKISANNSTITIQKGGTTVDSFTTNASSGKTINIPNELPTYSSSDAGKILSVNSSGQLVWITPATIYSGSSAPSNSTGNNGDIYLQS